MDSSYPAREPMTNQTIQSLGERVTYAWHESSLTIIIDQKIPIQQRLMLEGWFLAWMAVGVSMAIAMVGSSGSDRSFFLIFMAFWTFFAFRVLKVVLWRRMGREMVRITSEGMTVKNAFGDWGRARFFIKENIKKMEVVRRNPSNFLQNLDQSFWIMGGDSLQFTYLRSRFVLGKQLPEKDAAKLARLIDQALRKF